MAITRALKRLKRKKRIKEEDIAAKLAPLEELEKTSEPTQNGGAIIVDTNDIKIHKDFLEEERTGIKIFYIDPIVIVILVICISFIGFIAWLISISSNTKP
jgi:hypothetical protein